MKRMISHKHELLLPDCLSGIPSAQAITYFSCNDYLPVTKTLFLHTVILKSFIHCKNLS